MVKMAMKEQLFIELDKGPFCKLDVVRSCVEENSRIVNSMQDESTPLVRATQRYCPSHVVEYLLDQGAKLEQATSKSSMCGTALLCLVCRRGDKRLAKLFLNRGSMVVMNRLTSYGNSPLFVACSRGHFKIVELLVDRGADIELGTKYGVTPLTVACKKGHTDIVRFLLNHGANVLVNANHSGESPMSEACLNGKIAVVKLLVEQEGVVVVNGPVNGIAPIFAACKRGDLELVMYLAQMGADLEVLSNGMTAFMIALEKGHEEVMQFLLEQGASVCQPGESVFSLARRHPETVISLIEKGFIPFDISLDGVALMFSACEDGHLSLVKFLVSRGISINSRRHGSTPLLVAGQFRKMDIVQFLIAAGANVKEISDCGESPIRLAHENQDVDFCKALLDACTSTLDEICSLSLFWACKLGILEILQHLDRKGVDLNQVDSEGNSPLFVASKSGRMDAVKFLVENGADTGRSGHENVFPLHVASQNGHHDVVKYLLEKKADVQPEAAFGVSPLFLASQNGHCGIVELLVQAGADPDKARHDGATPLFIAAHESHGDVVDYLERVGANLDGHTNAGGFPLTAASHKGNAEVVKLLIDRGATFPSDGTMTEGDADEIQINEGKIMFRGKQILSLDELDIVIEEYNAMEKSYHFEQEDCDIDTSIATLGKICQVHDILKHLKCESGLPSLNDMEGSIGEAEALKKNQEEAFRTELWAAKGGEKGSVMEQHLKMIADIQKEITRSSWRLEEARVSFGERSLSLHCG